MPFGSEGTTDEADNAMRCGSERASDEGDDATVSGRSIGGCRLEDTAKRFQCDPSFPARDPIPQASDTLLGADALLSMIHQ